ncbi:unnamed protein product [Dicrocoelium dendriticum]|nr:unnamed protein product [Dicrocoelium dendriticum]
MPFYGPQCEHEAPTGSKTDKQLPARSDEMEPEVKRSVDRAMTITALVFILITFLGLVTLAWYLSSRRRKDYKRWCKMKGSSDVVARRNHRYLCAVPRGY